MPTDAFRLVNKTGTAVGIGLTSFESSRLNKYLREVNLTVRINFCYFFYIFNLQ